MKGVISVQELNILAFRDSYYIVILGFLLNLGTVSSWTSQSTYQVWEIPLLRIKHDIIVHDQFTAYSFLFFIPN